MIKIGEIMWNLWIYLECRWNTIKFCWPSSNSKRGGLTDICSWFSVGICLVDWSFVTTKINTSLKLGIKTILGTSHFSKKGCTNQIIICESFPYQPKRKRMMRALISRTHLYLQSWDLQWLTVLSWGPCHPYQTSAVPWFSGDLVRFNSLADILWYKRDVQQRYLDPDSCRESKEIRRCEEALSQDIPKKARVFTNQATKTPIYTSIYIVHLELDVLILPNFVATPQPLL